MTTGFGLIIQAIRAEQDLSQRELSKMSGVNRNVLRRLEAGEGHTAIQVLDRLLEVMGYELQAIGVVPAGELSEAAKVAKAAKNQKRNK